MIYVSTGGNSNQTAIETAHDYARFGIKNIELSGGAYDNEIIKNVEALIKNTDVQLHNYFPPPKEPFVINLASSNPHIVERTKKHIQFSIDLSAKINTRLYSFHAGFLLDPSVDDLGRQINKKPLMDRKKALDNFVKNVNDLAIYADSLGVSLLIENNVLSYENRERFKGNPLLMTDSKECEFVMQETGSNVSLLIDIAHLKVSANSLNFNAIKFLESLDPWIKAYHFSDNDGLSDSNNPIYKDSWFWPYIRSNVDYYSIETYGKSPEFLNRQVELVKTMLKISN
jgi:sugar phosphate isomerase/epimerase